MATSEEPRPRTTAQFVSNPGATSLPRESLSTALAAMVARAKGADPTEGFRLYEYVDPEALDALFDHSRRWADASWRLEFEAGEETIVVDSDGGIEVAGSAEPAPRPVVLVAEDDREMADLFADCLGDRYEVRTAYSGRSALQFMDEDVSVALIDRRMPDISGDNLLRTIRAEGYPCRVVLVSGMSPEADPPELEFDVYLQKPVSSRTLQDTVERLVETDGTKPLAPVG